jgi:two-component system LytT family response regulator
MTVSDCRRDGSPKHRQVWDCPSRANALPVSIPAELAASLEAANGTAAVEIIGREAPDLVFLDVQMPELNGLQVVETVGAAVMPLTVFVTAYDKHAIRAFEANVCIT